jgi:predicted Rossmann-fold nucleotide-binding protein
MRLGIVGSRSYTNENKIKATVSYYVENCGDKVTVVSGGCPDGADYLAKKVALDMGLEYVEFPPVHAKHNKYCVLPPEEYGKPYHVSNFFARNTKIPEYCDHLVAFVIKGIKANGTMDTFNKAKKAGKIVFLVED